MPLGVEQVSVPQLLGVLVAVLAAAKLFGALAQRIGQPAVLGELVAGVVLGMSVLGLVDSHDRVIHTLAEIGVVVLLLAIGLETDLPRLLSVGAASTAVALVGVALPFALGYFVCLWLGLSNLVAIVAGATLTATSVGITARVLSDLNRLRSPEGQIILGAAIIDDVIGLVILAVVAGIARGQEITVVGVAQTTGIAFGFLIGTLVIGRFIIPPLSRGLARINLPGTPTIFGIALAFGLGWLADASGSAVIIGAFAAGVLLRETSQAVEIEHGVASLGHLFVPIFFVSVGAAVDVRTFNPLGEGGWNTLMVGGALTFVAILGKFFAGYAAFWFKGNKAVIGVGMIPRGEVGLIFAQMGLTAGVFDAKMFSATMLMVMVTTFIAPPLLKAMLSPGVPPTRPRDYSGAEVLVSDP